MRNFPKLGNCRGQIHTQLFPFQSLCSLISVIAQRVPANSPWSPSSPGMFFFGLHICISVKLVSIIEKLGEIQISKFSWKIVGSGNTCPVSPHVTLGCWSWVVTAPRRWTWAPQFSTGEAMVCRTWPSSVILFPTWLLAVDFPLFLGVLYPPFFISPSPSFPTPATPAELKSLPFYLWFSKVWLDVFRYVGFYFCFCIYTAWGSLEFLDLCFNNFD